MFITAFKDTLLHLPAREAGYDNFMQHIDQEAVRRPVTEFFARVTNYALNKSPPSSSGSVCSAPAHYDPRIFLTAFAISRFPIEILISPEEPLRFTVLNKAIEFLGQIDTVLYAELPYPGLTH